MPGGSVIQLRSLSIRQRYRVRFQAFPDCIQQLRLLRSGHAIDLASQIAHTNTTLAWFLFSGKREATCGTSLGKGITPMLGGFSSISPTRRHRLQLSLFHLHLGMSNLRNLMNR